MSRSLFVAILLLSPLPALALEPKEVFVLANKNMPESKDVAEHYCKQRRVPPENIILLDLPATEDISREDYDAKIVAPVRAALKDKKEQAKVLLTVYGVPLRVGRQAPSEQDKAEIKKIDADVAKLQEELKDVRAQVVAGEEAAKKSPGGKTSKALEDAKKVVALKQAEIDGTAGRRRLFEHPESLAAVDSELMLLWWERYALDQWQLNLLYWQVPAKARQGKPPLVMTCRLDGPTVAIVKRLVDQAIEVEKKGLDGKVYVDARGIRFSPKNEDGNQYAGYDESMREMALLLEKEGKMKVVLDDQEPLFQPGACIDCALYCGWYSHANFVDCCKFVPGAVAWHLASSEAVSLRRADVKYWCKNQLEKGAIATLGPVAEPYTIGFPKPEEFFGFLATGKYTLVETYSRTIMLCSWMTVLVGDPLYNPFAKNPRLKDDQVLPSPKGGRLPFTTR
jgi:uncharacterized protein (TIGR03790 family)